jgi:hypothetical protein
MIPSCPRFIRSEGPSGETHSPCLGRSVRWGFYLRSSDSRIVQRFRCLSCSQGFSRATFSPRFGQKLRRVNPDIEKLYCSGVSQRRLALILQINRKTVIRKVRFLAAQARLEHRHFIDHCYSGVRKLACVQFDDLETSEHTKCKPLSVALAVDPKTRKILSFQVSPMPAKGELARIARRKYGFRPDERQRGWRRLLEELKPHVQETALLVSDENPHYPRHIRQSFPLASHRAYRSRRAAAIGQGELKRGGFDPLFALNHTCAMLRANMNRLFRRTWCTTKNAQGLRDHLAIYASFHNRLLTPAVPTG